MNNIYRSLGVPATGIRLRHEYAKHAFYDTWNRYIGGFSTTHSRLTPLLKEEKEPSRISLMYLIFLETRIIHLHFPADNLIVSIFIQFLPRDASAERGYKIAFVCLSVCDDQVS